MKRLDESSFSSRLSGRLKQLDMSYADLAEAVGVSKQAVGQWCSGSGAPHDGSAGRAAEALHVSIRWLLEGEGPKGRSGTLTPVERRQAALRARLREYESAVKAIRAELRALGRERDEAEERAWSRKGAA